MDQKKIGRLLRELRIEKNLTQEEFAEIIGVSNRSVSRWENGANLPDIDLLLIIAKYYGVGIGEILDGERMVEISDKQEETIRKVADYENCGKEALAKGLGSILIAALFEYVLFMIFTSLSSTGSGIYESISNFMSGMLFGTLFVGVFYTRRFMSKVRALKIRILRRGK